MTRYRSSYIAARAWNCLYTLRVRRDWDGPIDTARLEELASWPTWRWLAVAGCGVRTAPVLARIVRLAWRINRANLVSQKASDLATKLSARMPQLIGTMEGSSVLPADYRPRTAGFVGVPE